MEPLTVDVGQRAGGWTVVAPRGPLDVATSPALRQRLIELQVDPGTRLVLDLDAVEFIDSFGLAVVIGALKRARASAGELALRVTRERTRSLLELTRLDQVVRVVDDLDELAGTATGG